MENNKKFPLSHVALYSKGWYNELQEGRTIIDDLKICLNYDNHSGDLFNEIDIAMILSKKCSEYLGNKHEVKLEEIIEGISPFNCWKSGYYTNDCYFHKDKNSEPYNYYKAVIYYFMSVLRSCTVDELGGLPKPIYSRKDLEKNNLHSKGILSKPKRITSKRIKELFNN